MNDIKKHDAYIIGALADMQSKSARLYITSNAHRIDIDEKYCTDCDILPPFLDSPKNAEWEKYTSGHDVDVYVRIYRDAHNVGWSMCGGYMIDEIWDNPIPDDEEREEDFHANNLSEFIDTLCERYPISKSTWAKINAAIEGRL